MPTTPSLNLLRTFEAAARHLSFRKAADELHMRGDLLFFLIWTPR